MTPIPNQNPLICLHVFIQNRFKVDYSDCTCDVLTMHSVLPSGIRGAVVSVEEYLGVKPVPIVEPRTQFVDDELLVRRT